jgi:hypothetical protein
VAREGGIGIHPPLSRQNFYANKFIRDSMFQGIMIPFVWLQVPFDFFGPRPTNEDGSVKTKPKCTHLTWEQIARNAVDKIKTKCRTAPPYDSTKESHCLNFTDFGMGANLCEGVVLKVHYGTDGHTVTTVRYVEFDDDEDRTDGFYATRLNGEIITDPLKWINKFGFGTSKRNPAMVKCEIYNPNLDNGECRSLALCRKGKNGTRFGKFACVKTSYDSDGVIEIGGSVAGLWDERTGAENEYTDMVKTSSSLYNHFQPNSILDKQMKVNNPNNNAPSLFLGMVLRFDYIHDSFRTGKPELTLNEASLVPPGFDCHRNANEEWWIWVKIAEGLMVYMESYWGKWPQ